MSSSYNVALSAALNTLPMYLAAFALLPVANAGAISVSPINGATFVIPAGTTGVVRIPGGSTGVPIFVTLANPADEAIGASVAIRTPAPYAPPAPSVLTFGHASISIGSVMEIPSFSGDAMFLGAQSGTLTGCAIVSGSVALTGVLTAALTIRGSGGFVQVIPAGSSGLVPLSGPIGRGATYSFANGNSDWNTFDCFVVATTA